MCSQKLSFNFVTALILMLTLAACGAVESKQEYPKSEYDKERERYGSVLDDDGGFTLWSSKDKRKNAGDAGFGANGYLWRATLDTIGFMPLASADRNGGVILTDWYTPPNGSGERVKLNVLIKDSTLRADGVRVSVFRQIRASGGEWVDAAANPGTGAKLEDTILQRARQLKQLDGGKSDDN
ncbi:MAG: DUF3576 domain-containing protein [Bdellovibrionales bacterium]